MKYEAKVFNDSFKIMPPKEGLCPICAAKHAPEQPHNRDSLYYQLTFYQQNQRMPTWADAMEHCSDEVKAYWRNALIARGVDNDEL